MKWFSLDTLKCFFTNKFLMQTSYVFIIEIIMNVQEFHMYLPYYLLLNLSFSFWLSYEAYHRADRIAAIKIILFRENTKK